MAYLAVIYSQYIFFWGLQSELIIFLTSFWEKHCPLNRKKARLKLLEEVTRALYIKNEL